MSGSGVPVDLRSCEPTAARYGTRPAVAVAIAVAIMAIVCGIQLLRDVGRLADARLPNPDSYYKLVTLMDRTPEHGFRFVARDNAPHGSWMHWSMPHAAVIWQLHRPLRAVGLATEPALRYAGSALTLLSMVLVALFVALALIRTGTPRSAMLSGLVLAFAVPLHAYGRPGQITHHIFMLVPLAAAAACLLQRPTDHRPLLDLFGGLLLGLALWVSPETMPFAVGLAGVRIALRLQYVESASLVTVAAGMVGMIWLAWRIDPPPPTFSSWALDHISLASLLLVGLLALALLAADACAARGWPLRRSVPALGAMASAAAAAWLMLVPGALAGPTGLVPEELQRLFWAHIQELQPARRPAEWIGYLSLPVFATALAGMVAWQRRSLWLGGLALMALAYGLLGVWHLRMGAAATVAATLAFCAGAAGLRAFDDANDHQLSRATLAAAVLVALLPHLQLIAYTLLAEPAQKQQDAATASVCSLQPVATDLNRLPVATILTALSSGPELLYRTHHRVIAGPYHHNVDGMLDNFRAWRDSGDGRAEEILRRRGVEYVLGCTSFQHALRAPDGARSLAQRVAAGDVPAWLEAVSWSPGTDTGWRLYRVKLPAAEDTSAPRAAPATTTTTEL